MAIDLKPEQQRVIDLAVGSGTYQDPGEVLDQAHEIIREQLELEDWMLEQRASVNANIEQGFAQAECGELIDDRNIAKTAGRAAEAAGMSAAFRFTPQAMEDLDVIWWFIAEESRDAADRVELEIVATCGRLAKHPRIGTKRQE